MHRVLRCVVVLAVLVTAGCSGSSSTTSPSTTTPTTFTETFTGTLGPGSGATSHVYTFSVANPGTVTATLVSITPDTTAVVGLSLGTFSGTTCTDVIADDQTTQGITLTSSLAVAANLCVRVYLVGPLPNLETYQINAVHP
jgi:ABC-type glycerol-3-phosphate transport system substrate-binding protein